MSTRLRGRGSPLRTLFTATPWLCAAYLGSYVVGGSVLFVVSLAAVALTAVLGQLTIGLPLLIGGAWIVRGCAQVERGRAALLTGEPIPYSYQGVDEPGLFAHIRARCTDPAFVRDVAYLVGLFPILFVLDAVALGTWLLALAGVSLPLWFAAPADGGVKLGYLPKGRHDGGFGIWVGDLPTALVVAAVSLVFLLALSHLVIGAARLHLSVAQSMLRPHTDPLTEAKRMLAAPGPLTI